MCEYTRVVIGITADLSPDKSQDGQMTEGYSIQTAEEV
jgi:hypothetical protein